MKSTVHADRAVQFMPFDSLKSIRKSKHDYEDAVVERREMSEEYCSVLSEALRCAKRGDCIFIKYYHINKYVSVRGEITDIDFTLRYMKIAGKRIEFDDIAVLHRLM